MTFFLSKCLQNWKNVVTLHANHRFDDERNLSLIN